MTDSIVKKLMENHKLYEMAVSRGDAIVACMSLGKQFIEHYHEVYVGGPKNRDFLHHCQEMQTWYNSAKSMKLKTTKKPLTLKNLEDWFFEVGALAEDYLNDTEELDSYHRVIRRFTKEDNKDILSDIIQQEVFKLKN